jgi:hypothetical protein
LNKLDEDQSMLLSICSAVLCVLNWLPVREEFIQINSEALLVLLAQCVTLFALAALRKILGIMPSVIRPVSVIL